MRRLIFVILIRRSIRGRTLQPDIQQHRYRRPCTGAGVHRHMDMGRPRSKNMAVFYEKGGEMDIERQLKRALNSIDEAQQALKRAKGRDSTADSDIQRALRELDDADSDIRRALRDMSK